MSWSRKLGCADLGVVVTTAVVLALGGAACAVRSLGADRPGDDWDAGANGECHDLGDCNPSATCGELVVCQDQRCRPDLGRVFVPCVVGECSQDTDCLVAHPITCCWGCPEVLSRLALAERACFYEAGHPPDDAPAECLLECAICPECIPQPLGARCDAGACVATDLGCPALTEPAPPATTTDVLVRDVAAHEGQRRRVRGVVLPGEGSCDGEGCTSAYGSVLNGVVRLDGTQCERSVDLWGLECRADLRGGALAPGAWYELEGTVLAATTPWEEPSLEVTGLRLVEPGDLGGHYPVIITSVESDASDPVCVPSHFSAGDGLDLYLARSGAQVHVAVPAFHCETNLSGGFDSGEAGPFSVWLPIDCDWCDFHLSGTVSGELLVGEYVSQDGPCRHVIHIEGRRSR